MYFWWISFKDTEQEGTTSKTKRRQIKVKLNTRKGGHLPFLTISFMALLQGRAPTLMLALQLRHTSLVLLDQLAGLAVVFPNQLLHLLVLLSLLPNEALLLLQLLHCLSLQF